MGESFQPDDASDDKHDAEKPSCSCRFCEKKNAKSDGADRADTGPDRIARSQWDGA